MSTTVEYKGNVLTTVNNETRTLLTSGKYLEGNLTLTDVTSGGGGGGNSKDPVKFIDYDGTILHSYSVSDFMALDTMPSNPTHTGLTSQGWNWSLADAKAYLTNYPEAELTIGQMYITDDGKTRLYVHFEEGRLHPYLGICPNGTVVVDWGDNSATSTLTGTSLATVQHADHEYASAGDYIITLTVSSGSFAFYGVNNTSHILKKDTSTTANIHHVYTNCLQKVEIGTSASIGDYAFNYCYSLASITIPDTVMSIGTYAFYFCYSLASITIPDTVTSIETYAFYGCYSLASITIPNTVTSIGTNAFYNCYSLVSVTIPGTVTSIGSGAFYNCYSLVSVTIPGTVTSIGNSAFYSCHSLDSVTILDGVTNIGNSAFNYCYSLTSITIPDTMTSIGSNAFNGCRSLASIIISGTVTSIEDSAFYNCFSLVSVTIPGTVTSIGNSAFYSCHSLASITIPDTVTNIKVSAFYNCYGMAEYHFLSTTPPTLAGTNVFYNIQSDCVIYVPQESLSAYKTASNWKTYASYMVGE